MARAQAGAPSPDAPDAPGEAPTVVAGEVIVVTPARSPDAARALDEPAFATVVHTGDHRGETTTVAEVLAESVGVRVSSLGGLGAFSSLSIRGTGSGATTVLIDGVPLSRVAQVGVDLGRFELETFDRIEVYRGGAPAQFGAATLGGAVNLITHLDGDTDDHMGASLGFGSFGARHALARYTGSMAGQGVSLVASYRAAEGDFPYFSDGGTNLNPSDDRQLRRTNNAFQQVDLVARVGRSERYALGSRFLFKTQGVPGFGSIQTENTSLGTMSELVDGSYRTTAGGTSLGIKAFGYVERAHYLDPDDEVGLGAQNRRYLTLAAGASAGAGRRWGRHLAALSVDARVDHFDERQTDDGSSMRRTSGGRLGLGGVARDDIDLAAAAVLLRPSVRLDVMRTWPAVDSNAALGVDSEPRTDVFASPRLAARWRALPWLALKSSAGLFVRAPTLPELFGDRGYVVGNPDLRTERGVSADVGVIAAPTGTWHGIDRRVAELALFGNRSTDTIAFSSNAGGFTGAVNLEGALIGGIEASGSLRLARLLTLTGNYTLLWTRQSSSMPSIDENELPGRPRHQLYGRADVELRPFDRGLDLWLDSALTASMYLDAGNRNPVPRRLFVGAGARVELLAGFVAGFEIKNLFDERVESVDLSPPPRPDLTSVRRAVADYFGYPLPGRALYATLELTL